MEDNVVTPLGNQVANTGLWHLQIVENIWLGEKAFAKDTIALYFRIAARKVWNLQRGFWNEFEKKNAESSVHEYRSFYMYMMCITKKKIKCFQKYFENSKN